MFCKINKIVIAVFFVVIMATMSFSQSIQVNSSGIQLNPNAVCPLQLYNNGCTCGDPLLFPTTNGKGFLGTSTNYFHCVYANLVYYNQLQSMSDSTLKENITDLENVFDKIKNIRTIRFDYKPLKNVSDSINEENKNRIGFIAQDIMNYFPELVKKNGNGKYSVNYVEMIPVLVKAVQDLKTIVDKQDSTITDLTRKVGIK